jgi:HK97 family phage major capsid protein
MPAVHTAPVVTDARKPTVLVPNDDVGSQIIHAFLRRRADDNSRRRLRALGVPPDETQIAFMPASPRELAALGTQDDIRGGFLTGEYSAQTRFAVALQQSDVFRAAGATVIQDTDERAEDALVYPVINDLDNEGEFLVEETQAQTAADWAVGAVVLKGGELYGSKILKASRKLARLGVAFSESVTQELGKRLGRIQFRRQTQFVLDNATAGVTAASAAAVSADEFLALCDSVDADYMYGPTGGAMMHSSMYRYFMRLKDSTSNYVFDRLRPSEPPHLNGVRVYFNRNMSSTPTSGTVSVLAGAFSGVVLRDVGPVRLQVINELYAEQNQIGYVALALHSFGLQTEGSPLQRLVQP